MPSKSKRSKAKKYQQAKTGGNIQRQNTAATATAENVMPAATAAPAPAVVQATKSSTATAAATKANQYAYVPGDLRRIGILSGIIIAILIVLYFVLP